MNFSDFPWFVGRFAIAPRAALQPYQGLNAIDPSLAFYGLAGSLLAAFIVAIAIWSGVTRRDDVLESSGMLLPRLVLPPWSWITWPATSVAVILTLTAIVHVFAFLWHAVRTATGITAFDETLGGGWHNTANALFAANTLLSPLVAVVVAAAPRMAPLAQTVLTLAVTLALFGYPMFALAGAHPNTSLDQTFGVLIAPIAVPLTALLLAGWILRTLSRFILNIQRQR